MPIGRTTGCFVLFYATSTVVETFVSAGLHHACAMAQLLPTVVRWKKKMSASTLICTPTVAQRLLKESKID
jgi:hypothetical protein